MFDTMKMDLTLYHTKPLTTGNHLIQSIPSHQHHCTQDLGKLSQNIGAEQEVYYDEPSANEAIDGLTLVELSRYSKTDFR